MIITYLYTTTIFLNFVHYIYHDYVTKSRYEKNTFIIHFIIYTKL